MPTMPNRTVALVLASVLFTSGSPVRACLDDWDSPTLWTVEHDPSSRAELSAIPGNDVVRLRLDYQLMGPGTHWVQMRRFLDEPADLRRPLTFLVRGDGDATLEIKWIDEDGANYLCRLPLGQAREWRFLALYPSQFEYGWGGQGRGSIQNPRAMAFALSGTAGKGTVYLDDICFGKPGTPATSVAEGPRPDPDRAATGFGFRARRAKRPVPEDAGVLAWLKATQDTGSPEGRLLPSMEDGLAQTFNNALAAMAFPVKGERARAERILDFFQAATREDNTVPTLQNFFVNGEPRGFFQTVFLRDAERPAYHAAGDSDRWMGDMAWLLIAAEHHRRVTGTDRYARLRGLLADWLVDAYRPDGRGGYVRGGWRRLDRDGHAPQGHPEGNIDAYAALRLAGRRDLADAVARWLEDNLRGTSLPLDLYTWRVLAFGSDDPGAADVLRIPEEDLRFRKTVRLNGRPVSGFFNVPTAVENLWLDGTGHMACAHYALGDTARGHFYANQMDPFLMDRTLGAHRVRALPYTADRDGGYEWVDTGKGFTSTACWYLFAKNRFNPLRLETAPASF
jgi:hypothetical protein